MFAWHGRMGDIKMTVIVHTDNEREAVDIALGAFETECIPRRFKPQLSSDGKSLIIPLEE